MRASRIARIVGRMMVLGVLAVGPAKGDATSAARLEGLRLYGAGHFAEAIPYFDQVLARHPRDLEILNRRGICYLRTEQAQKALADFDRVNGRSVAFTRNFPNGFFPASAGITEPIPHLWYPESYGNRGISLLMLGRDQEALDSFLTATRLWALQGRFAPARSRAGAGCPGVVHG